MQQIFSSQPFIRSFTPSRAVKSLLMSSWTRVYDDAQRAAIECAYVEHGAKIASIVAKAKAGELQHEGKQLEPFDIPYASAAYIAKRARQARQGHVTSDISHLDGPDTVDNLRKRLANLAAYELNRQETRAKGHKDLDLKRLSEIGRVSREIAALPAAQDRRLPTKPGDRDHNGNQSKVRPVTATPLATQILATAQGESEQRETHDHTTRTAGIHADMLTAV